jgi:hypothetical protein
MISLYLVSIGSGKTACAVREISQRVNHQKVYSNIVLKGKLATKNFKVLDDYMIFSVVQDKKTGKLMPDKLNIDYWKQQINEPVTIVLDELHNLINARKTKSKINVIMTDFLALLRRVIGSLDKGTGELIGITQLPRRLDVVFREMATNVKYHICYYKKTCKKCGLTWAESSETPETKYICPRCKSPKLDKHTHIIEVFSFRNIRDCEYWLEFGKPTYYKHHFIYDIEKYFKYYDTYSFDNLISKYY